jgi:hypothetical protein
VFSYGRHCLLLAAPFFTQLAEFPAGGLVKPERPSRTTVYRSRWVNLFVDKVCFPNGRIIERHHLLDFERPSVVAVVEDDREQVLLVSVCRYTTLELDVYDYLSCLPLDRVVQIHVSGPRVRNDRLADVHEPLQEIDYAVLDFVLARTHPQVVTLEYIRERDVLREQLFRLGGVLGLRRDRLS